MFGLTPDIFLARILVIFLGIPIHEWAHGWMASLLGDETPAMQGRLSLNPFVHLDPVGTLMILFSGFGWGKAARVNPYRMWRVKNPRVGMALSAMAGPLSNILQAMVLAIPIRLGLLALLPSAQALWLWNVLSMAILVNIGLATFNMIPIPPLDGSKVLAGLASPGVAQMIENLEPIAPMFLMALLFVLPQMGINVIGSLIAPVQEFLLKALLLW